MVNQWRTYRRDQVGHNMLWLISSPLKLHSLVEVNKINFWHFWIVFHSTEGGVSCTNETSYAVGPWLGTGPEFTIVDTPGFQDTDDVST